MKPFFKPLLPPLALIFGLAVGCSSSASPTDAAGDGKGGRAGAGADASGSGGTIAGSGGASPTGSGGSGGTADGGDAASDRASNDADATGSGGAGGRDGGTGGADAGTGGAGDSGTDRSGDADLNCIEVAMLRLSELTVNMTAAAGGTAQVQVTVANTADRFISYAGAALECDEMGTLVIDASTNWLFGITAGGKSNYIYAVRIAPSAPSGATIHCTARAATVTALHCPDAETLRTEFKVR